MKCQTYIWILVLFCGMSSCSYHADADAQAWYEQGRELRQSDDQEQAMRAFLRAANSGAKDERLIGRVWSNIANMCRQANEHNKAFHTYAVSAGHFAAANDTLAYAYALNNMAWEQAVMGHKDSALALIHAAVQSYPRQPLTDKIIESHAAACLFAEEYDSVLFYTASSNNDYLLMLRAQAYSFLQIDDSAAYYAQLLLPRTTSLPALDDLYYILSHNDVTADKELIRTFSSKRADVQKAIEARHVKLTQAVLLLEQNKEDHLPFVMVAFWAALFGLALSIWALFVWRKHRLWHLRQATQRQFRRNELTHTIQLLQEAPDLRNEIAWDNFTELCRRIDKMFYGLVASLQEKGLNEQDIRICLLVLLRLSHKEMAEMLHCSPKSIGKLKDITAHKLSVSGGNLYDRLLEICET